MKFLQKKSLVLVVAALSILALAVIIASLGGLAFKPARPFVFQTAAAPAPTGHNPSPEIPIYVLIAVLVAFLTALFFLLPPESRKKYLWTLARLVLIGVVVFLILSQISLGQNAIQPPAATDFALSTPQSGPQPTPEPEITPAVYVPPTVSPWISYAVGLAFLLVAVGIFGWVWLRRRQENAPYEALAEAARIALRDLEAGRDWGDTVLTCYYRMIKIVETGRGLHRRVSMTPGEFADHLASSGLPNQAVHTLTGLFERVRYGDRKSTRKDVKAASESLTAILEFCEARQ